MQPGTIYLKLNFDDFGDFDDLVTKNLCAGVGERRGWHRAGRHPRRAGGRCRPAWRGDAGGRHGPRAARRPAFTSLPQRVGYGGAFLAGILTKDLFTFDSL